MRDAVNAGEMLQDVSSVLSNETCSHISGSFFISAIAASGIPKFDAGPQKSVSRQFSFLNSL